VFSLDDKHFFHATLWVFLGGNMEDKELLELAAKAAGISIKWSIPFASVPELLEADWNPLEDDGDALLLAVKLRMRVEPWGSGASAVVSIDNRAIVAEAHYGDDPARATRRAIVRAAAEIGKAE
jgi:hypothetical protein